MQSEAEPRTWTFQPDDAVKSLVAKAITKERREAKRLNKPFNERGLRTKLLNEALRRSFANLAGKREQP